MVTTVGLPPCITVSVFDKSTGSRVIWSENGLPDGTRFCEFMGIEPEGKLEKGNILVSAPKGLLSTDSSHAEVFEYTYTWNGTTYSLQDKRSSLEFIPAERRMTRRPE